MIIIFFKMIKKPKKIIVASRSSPLAKRQLEIFNLKLKKFLEEKFSLSKVFFKTRGDMFLTDRLSTIGNKGLFTKEIDQAQISKKVDISIHSLKDLPTKLEKGLVIGALLKREDSRDALISRDNLTIFKLRKNAIIGTSSLRREMLVKKIRPDLKVRIIRGNVESRIKKVVSGKYDATFLAMAGLKRLKILKNFKPMNPEKFVPSPGQGIIAVVLREDDKALLELVKPINDKKTSFEAECERGFLDTLDGDCALPIGALAKLDQQKNEVKFCYYYENLETIFFERKKIILNSDQARYDCIQIALDLKKRAKKI